MRNHFNPRTPRKKSEGQIPSLIENWVNKDEGTQLWTQEYKIILQIAQ